MSTSYYASVVFGVKLDESMIPKSLTHEEEKYAQCPVCKRTGDPDDLFCSKCGAAMKEKAHEIKNYDLDPDEYSHAVVKPVTPKNWKGYDAGYHVSGYESGYEEGDTILGKGLISSIDVTRGNHDDTNLITLTDADRIEVKTFLDALGIDATPQLWLVTSCG